MPFHGYFIRLRIQRNQPSRFVEIDSELLHGFENEKPIRVIALKDSKLQIY